MNPAGTQHKHAPAGFGFDDAGARVPIADFDFGDSTAEERGAAQAALEAIHKILLLAIDGGHSDAISTRLGALAFLFRTPGYQTVKEVSDRTGVSHSNVSRTISTMRERLLRTPLPIR